jgi:hypothetical protein
MKPFTVVLVFLIACVVTAKADSIVVTAPAGTDLIDWAQFGPAGSLIDPSFDNPFNLVTANSVQGTGVWGNAGPSAFGAGSVATEGNGFVGNFTYGQTLNYDNDSGPLTISFSNYGFTQIGVQIASAGYGDFVAQVCDNTDGICFTEDGTSSGAEDGSAIYIGISNTAPISSVTFSLTGVTSGDVNDFAVSNVTLDGGAANTVVPEGGLPWLYLPLAGAYLLAAIRFGWKRAQRTR